MKLSGARGARKSASTTPRIDPYQDATDKACAAIENGTAPWMPSRTVMPLPRNGVTNNQYHGINIMNLMGRYEDPRWCSFKQAEKSGLRVIKGEKASHLYFFKPLKIKDTLESGQEEEKTIPYLTRYAVFNFSQLEKDGEPLEAELQDTGAMCDPDTLDMEQVEILETILENAAPNIERGASSSGYAPNFDTIYLTDDSGDLSNTANAVDLIHQLCHWTGGPDRLSREFGASRKSSEYAAEELRATMASAIVCAKLGIPHDLRNHADYSAQQLALLSEDKKLIFKLSKDAEQVARWVCSYHPEMKEEIEQEYMAQVNAAKNAGAPEDVFSFDEIDFQDPAFDPDVNRLTM
ncbi:zincin-like metallopeptidase domain-containing protein [Aeromonas veronii]|uniref:ArdC family protein n=1 Tax=Aeromonas TaxID=642 RepID=UPI0031586FB3